MKLKLFILIALFLYIFPFSPMIGNIYATGNEILFSDDFNSGSFDKWESARASSAQWNIRNEKAHSLILTPFTTVELVPSESNWNNEWKNLEYSLEMKPLQGIDKNIVFTFSNPNDWIDIHFFFNQFEVAHYLNGVNAFAKRGSFIMENDQTYHIKILKLNSNLSIYIENNLIFENQFPLGMLDGKISLKATTGAQYPTEIEFDNVVVRAIDATGNFPHFKQDDPLWASEEYNHALQWSSSGTGIKEYGCALTSAAMILHAHGITELPNEDEINPSTLNSWLLAQDDGYIGSGLLNFAAITRLTRELNEQKGTTKLEYGRRNSDPRAVADQELNDNRPVILQIDGHFLVAYDQKDGELLIKDPAYTYSLFSQHSKDLLSTRTFTPSNTDLSYIIIAHDPAISLTITDQNNQVIATSHDDYLTDPNTSTSSPTSSILEFAKPETGIYTITIQGEIFSNYSFDLYTYDAIGEATHSTQSGTFGTIDARYELEYAKDSPSTTSELYSWADFAADINQLYAKNHISKYYLAQSLLQHTNIAEAIDSSKQQALIERKKHLISWFIRGISPETKLLLLERLQTLEENL